METVVQVTMADTVRIGAKDADLDSFTVTPCPRSVIVTRGHSWNIVSL